MEYERKKGEGEKTEEETNIEISYISKRNIYIIDVYENSDDGEGVETCSEKSYQLVHTELNENEGHNLSFIIDMDTYQSNSEERLYSEGDR